MVLLKDEPKTETAPKADAAGTAAGTGERTPTTPGSDADASSTAPAEGDAKTDASAETHEKPATPSKAQLDFEAKLEELAKLDLSVKEQAKEIAKAKSRLDRYTPLDEHLTKGELKAAAKKFFGEKYTAELLLELADDFAPPEMSVEDRVKKTLEEERKVREEEQRKRDEEKAAADKAAVETETKAYLGATAEFLRTHKEQFPLICAWDDDPDIDHERMIDSIWRDHYAKTGEVPSPDKVLEQVEQRHLARIKKTRFFPQEPQELSLEEYAGTAPPKEQPKAAPPPVENRPRSGVEEAYARFEQYEREQKQRELLSYGR